MKYLRTEKELTGRVILLAIILTLILAMSNAYLALKIGILTSASIPAAVISMGVLRFFKHATIYENNLVQTAASAGEAVAGGIVYTIPALIIIRYWHAFPYWENLCIALIGGVLGVLFSVPIRRVLVHERSLPFPEGQAIAEVLKTGQEQPIGLRYMLWGSAVGALIEFAQSGLKIIANSWQSWFVSGRYLFGFGAGFSVTMISAGYLIGAKVCFSIFLGALIGWLFGMPVVSAIYFTPVNDVPVVKMVMDLWWSKMSYFGISAMLFAGLVALVNLIKPFYSSFKLSLRTMRQEKKYQHIPAHERDIPLPYVFAAILLTLIGSYFFLQKVLPLQQMGLQHYLQAPFLIICTFYLLIIGFIFSAITGYFSGLVGVTASPGSAIIIAGLLLAALSLNAMLVQPDSDLLLAAEAVVIIIGAIITGSAAIANDNIQDLKVGQIIGATPWKQQIMLLLGVTISALVIPPIMQLLFSVYGIADVLPHANMDPTQTLPAPPAALMATITRGVFNHQLPMPMLLAGAGVVLLVVMINFKLKAPQKISVLGVAIGIYLPLASSIPLFIGGFIAWIVQRRNRARNDFAHKHKGVLLACGLMAGSVLMDMLLAIPFSIYRNPNVLRIMPEQGQPIALFLSVCMILLLGYWFYRIVCSNGKNAKNDAR